MLSKRLTKYQIMDLTGSDKWSWVKQWFDGDTEKQILAKLDDLWPETDNSNLAANILERLS